MNPEGLRPSDHDLLIELNAKFGSFESASSRAWVEMNDKISRVLIQLENKADKADLQIVKQSIDRLEARVHVIETARATETTRKETVVHIGNLGLKTWAFIAGLILFIISVMNTIRGK